MGVSAETNAISAQLEAGAGAELGNYQNVGHPTENIKQYVMISKNKLGLSCAKLRTSFAELCLAEAIFCRAG